MKKVFLLTVTSTVGKIFKCVVVAENPQKAISGFFLLFCATKDIKSIEVEELIAINQDGSYLDRSM